MKPLSFVYRHRLVILGVIVLALFLLTGQTLSAHDLFYVTPEVNDQFISPFHQ